jgi:hypothetical protein
MSNLKKNLKSKNEFFKKKLKIKKSKNEFFKRELNKNKN